MKIARSLALAASLLASAGPAVMVSAPAQAALPSIVYDPTAVAQMVQQVSQLKAQLQTLTNTYTKVTQQLETAQKAYQAVTGARGMGDLFNSPALRKYMPQDMRKVYDAAKGGGFTGITGSVDAILSSEALTGTVAERQAAIRKRQRNNAATSQLMAQDAYAGAEARLDNLDSLLGQINSATDPKAISDLQARIAIEQARVAAEAQKMQMMSYMAAAQEKLAKEQEQELHQKLWSNANSGMPHISK